jgi:beta-lactamase regulating signal transducer with metallopeptidase domain
MNHFLFELATRSFILAGLGLGIRFALLRSSAHARANVLAVTMVALEVLPLALVVLPRLSVTVAQTKVVEQLSTQTGSLGIAPEAPFVFPWMIIWATLATIMLARVVGSLAKFKKMEQGFTHASESLTERVMGLAIRAREVFFCPAGEPPMTWGLFEPKIALPTESETWVEDQLRSVVLHEDAHIRRLDWAVMIGFRVVNAIYWFNPLVWVLKVLFDQDSERAADDFVLAQGVDAPEYAERLVEVAKSMQLRHSSIPAVTMARSNRLNGRVSAILNSQTNRLALKGWTRFSVLGLLALGAIAAGVVMPEIKQVRVSSRQTVGENNVRNENPSKAASISTKVGPDEAIWDTEDLMDSDEDSARKPEKLLDSKPSKSPTKPPVKSVSHKDLSVSADGLDNIDVGANIKIDMGSIEKDVHEGFKEAQKDIDKAKKEAEKGLKDAEKEIDEADMPDAARAAAKQSLKMVKGLTDGLLGQVFNGLDPKSKTDPKEKPKKDSKANP